jgi:hypothetical protein
LQLFCCNEPGAKDQNYPFTFDLLKNHKILANCEKIIQLISEEENRSIIRNYETKIADRNI